jgi:hypothetical protein
LLAISGWLTCITQSIQVTPAPPPLPQLPAYAVVWDTRSVALTDGDYHITVSPSLGSQPIGYADARVVPLNQVASVPRAQYVPLVPGVPFLIAFRIEGCPDAAQDCAEATFNPSTGEQHVTTPNQQAAASFPGGYFGQTTKVLIAKVSNGCFVSSFPTSPLDNMGCYAFTTSPRVNNPLGCTAAARGDLHATPADLLNCVRVEECVNIPTSLAPPDLRLFKSDAGLPAQQLQEAPAPLVGPHCPTASPYKRGRNGVVDLALERWHRVTNALGRLVLPEPLYGATAMVHVGVGGLTCCFSNIGWGSSTVKITTPLTVSPASLSIGGPAGTASVTVTNLTRGGGPVTGLVVQGWIEQAPLEGPVTVRRAAGTSAPFSLAASTTFSVPPFSFIASNTASGTGPLECGFAMAEFDLVQGTTVLNTFIFNISLCPPTNPR